MSEMIGEGRTAQIFALDDGRVLKLFYDWVDLSSVKREFEATQVAFLAGVPVPKPYEVIEQSGRKGIIYERIMGKSGVALFRQQPWRLNWLVSEIAKLQVQTLAVHAPGLPDMHGHLDRAIRRSNQFGLDEMLLNQILERLKNLPEDDHLCHMDFHPDNVMRTSDGWMIIDWMNARSGSPLADVARSSVIYQVSGPPPGVHGGFIISFGSRMAFSVYNRKIRALMKFTPIVLEAWVLPIAAARLVENIPGEREKLIAMITRLLNK